MRALRPEAIWRSNARAVPRSRCDQRGAQAVEFALLLPFFLAVLLLVIDAGFMVYDKALITNASREGARAAMLFSSGTWAQTQGSAKAVVCAALGNTLINTGTGTRNAGCTGTADPVITVSNANNNDPPLFGDAIKVTVAYTYQGLLRSLIAPASGAAGSATPIASGWAMTSSTVMIHE